MTIPSQDYTGSETVSGTEWSLTTDTSGPDAQTTVGLYQAFIDFNALVVTDTYQVKVYEKIISGGTQRLVETFIINGPLTGPIWVSPAFPLMWGWDFTLLKIAGADAAITWSIRNIAADAGSTLATASALSTTDTAVSAIKTQTDKFVFTVANQVDANIQYVNDVQVTGTGASGNEWGPL